jgi:putative ABC transport system ATP-binding protein
MHAINLNELFYQTNTTPPFSLAIDQLTIHASQHLFLEGPSGSGKTTLLNLFTGILFPNSGQISVLGTDIATLSNPQRDRFRADHFGIIFQAFNLIPFLSIAENIALPCTFSQVKKARVLASHSIEAEVQGLCQDLNMDAALLNRPVHKLSIGQQQRVAIARALIGQPDIIIADEPTSALDEENKQAFIETLLNECKKRQSTLIFVSHDTSLKHYFNHVYTLSKAPT